jgi:hypothetical protein
MPPKWGGKRGAAAGEGVVVAKGGKDLAQEEKKKVGRSVGKG